MPVAFFYVIRNRNKKQYSFSVLMWKSPKSFLCQWIKTPTLLKVTRALIPYEKAAKIPAVESDRSISQFFPSLSYPSPAVFCIISLDLFCYMLSPKKIFLCISLLIYLNSHLVPLGSIGLLERSFIRHSFPWSIRSCFLGVD